MSRTLNIISNNVQGYGPSESTSLPCLGVSGRAVSVSTCPRNEYKISQVKIISSKCSLKHRSFICQANNGGYRRNPDFPRHNRSGYSRNRNRLNEEKDSSENLDESEFLSTKNGPLLSLSNSPKSQATATPGPREREIVELFKKVQAQLRQRAVVKEEKKLEAVKGQNKESETVDSLLKLLRKHSVEQGKRKVNGGGANDFNFDHPRQSGQSNEEKSKSFFSSSSIVREEPQETNKPSFTRPPSEFRRRSPVPRIKYEPIVSHSDLDVRTDEETLSELDPEAESDSDLEPDMDLESGLELEHEEETEEEAEVDLEVEAEFVESPTISKLSEAELLDAEEDFIDEEDAEKEHTEDLNAMKLTELRALAKSRGMKGFSKLKKSELVGLLSDDSM
ncbi:rho-N domain-containing protein 1, chloroplastic-like [Chenopodium quinoa]|uniref:rho-N domain-containing protein 1, chloroplastic-like n=1 Tax=Chenopodium quinoa TaxID=63459 RepID=UPI000B774789|nr:rho-N domain-containing protein 1, chloroplastic-like [Chenopodium quinoa]